MLRQLKRHNPIPDRDRIARRMIVSAKERRLKKGTGFHLNIVVLGVLNTFLSMFGMPWVCCAAVRSITHTNRSAPQRYTVKA